ncbi:MAG: 2Fe-2S iron-sulfur cluster binding domain-containing protein [Enterobacteriaceae bacterium]
MKKIFLIKKKSVIIYNKKKDKNILQVLLKNKIKILYQCKIGLCGICNVSLIKGFVSYLNNNNFFNLNNKVILSCISFPITNIYLNI